ncbi:hypothetical protein R5R35_007168 [Gryllus longicercus]|uniref:Uncharacterized protein n=1 Tax=Gryllus longicercus TaxID=2509291 RepID=A0AAN9VAQ7_9ORTH
MRLHKRLKDLRSKLPNSECLTAYDLPRACLVEFRRRRSPVVPNRDLDSTDTLVKRLLVEWSSGRVVEWSIAVCNAAVLEVPDIRIDSTAFSDGKSSENYEHRSFDTSPKNFRCR